MSGSPGSLIKLAPVIPEILELRYCHSRHSALVNRPFWYTEHTVIIWDEWHLTYSKREWDAWVAHSV